MIFLSNESIGKHFVRADNGELIRSHFQYLSMHTHDWEASTCTASDNYKITPFGSVYRKPVDLIGWGIILPKFVKRRIGILFFNIGKLFR